MLSCGDELLNLPLGLLQPYAICVPDFNHANGHPVGMNQGIFVKMRPIRKPLITEDTRGLQRRI